MKTRVASVVLDLLAGLGALAVFVAADNEGADLRSAIVTLAVLYLGAGVVRGRSGSLWVKGLLVSGGGALVLFVLGLSSIDHTILAILLLTTVLFSICGVLARRFWVNHFPGRASLALLVPLAALLAVVLATIPHLTAQIATRKTTTPTPVFAVSRMDGTVVQSTEWRGRVVVLDYWATWCPACRHEMPELEKLYRRYQADPNVVFWAVDVQKNGETPQKAGAFMRQAGYTLPVAIDSQNSAERLGSLLAVDGYPALILIDRGGRVRLVHTGYDGSERLVHNLSREINALLGESPRF
jgi:thiol-disulfide isomerase/thioredoxin